MIGQAMLYAVAVGAPVALGAAATYRFTPLDLDGIPVEARIYLSYTWSVEPEESAR